MTATLTMQQHDAKHKWLERSWKLESLDALNICVHTESLARMAKDDKPFTVYLTIRSRASDYQEPNI